MIGKRGSLGADHDDLVGLGQKEVIACGLFGSTLVITQRRDLASKDVIFSACEVVLLVLLVDLCAHLLVRALGACGMSDPPSIRCGDGHAR